MPLVQEDEEYQAVINSVLVVVFCWGVFGCLFGVLVVILS
jgi:hypothetical protein